MTGYNYRSVEVGRLKPGDEMRSANGRTWLPPVKHSVQERPVSESGITSIWWGPISAAERRPDTRMLATTLVRIRRPKGQANR